MIEAIHAQYATDDVTKQDRGRAGAGRGGAAAADQRRRTDADGAECLSERVREAGREGGQRLVKSLALARARGRRGLAVPLPAPAAAAMPPMFHLTSLAATAAAHLICSCLPEGRLLELPSSRKRGFQSGNISSSSQCARARDQ